MPHCTRHHGSRLRPAAAAAAVHHFVVHLRPSGSTKLSESNPAWDWALSHVAATLASGNMLQHIRHFVAGTAHSRRARERFPIESKSSSPAALNRPALIGGLILVVVLGLGSSALPSFVHVTFPCLLQGEIALHTHKYTHRHTYVRTLHILHSACDFKM